MNYCTQPSVIRDAYVELEDQVRRTQETHVRRAEPRCVDRRIEEVLLLATCYGPMPTSRRVGVTLTSIPRVEYSAKAASVGQITWVKYTVRRRTFPICDVTMVMSVGRYENSSAVSGAQRT